MRRTLAFIYGSIIGAMIGAVLALLIAPTSGNELRIQVQERVRFIQGELKSAAASRRIELERQLSALRAPRNPEQ
jgi:gas vesicle protein